MVKILVVEDNDTMRLGISESLRREGYNVFAYDNGPAALQYLEEKPVDLAIVDLKMAPMDGVETLKRIKKKSPETLILMISAYGTVDTAVNAMHLGAADFLTKPFSPEELRIRIKKLWQQCQTEKRIASLEEQNRLLNQDLFSGYTEIIGSSPQIIAIFKL